MDGEMYIVLLTMRFDSRSNSLSPGPSQALVQDRRRTEGLRIHDQAWRFRVGAPIELLLSVNCGSPKWSE